MTTNIKPSLDLLQTWAQDEHVQFVSRSDGQRTTETVGMDALLLLVDRAVAAERERWATPVRALLISHDEGLRLLGEMMRSRGVASVTLPIDTRDGFDAIEVLRGLLKEQR